MPSLLSCINHMSHHYFYSKLLALYESEPSPCPRLFTLLHLLQALELGKRPLGGTDALKDQGTGDDDPEGVAQEVVGPEIVVLGPAVVFLVHEHGEGAGGVVQDVAIDLADADDELERVAQGVAGHDGVGDEEGDGAPEEGGDGLHGDEERVLGEVAGVGEGVLLPELAEEVELAGHVLEVVGEVAFKESVDEAAEDEPQGGKHLPAAQVGSLALDQKVRGHEDGTATQAEVRDELQRIHRVGRIPGDDDPQGVVRMRNCRAVRRSHCEQSIGGCCDRGMA